MHQHKRGYQLQLGRSVRCLVHDFRTSIFVCIAADSTPIFQSVSSPTAITLRPTQNSDSQLFAIPFKRSLIINTHVHVESPTPSPSLSSSYFPRLPTFFRDRSMHTLAANPSESPPHTKASLCPCLAASCCILPIYCRLTVFHAFMYFSIHCVRHCCSPELNEAPGFGTHFSKQFSETFYTMD